MNRKKSSVPEFSVAKIISLGKALPHGSFAKIAREKNTTMWKVRGTLSPTVSIDPDIISAAVEIYNASSLTGPITVNDLR